MANYLQNYRNLSSFSSRELAYFLEGRDAISFKDEIYKTLEKDPLFHQSATDLSTEDHQILALKWYKRITEYNFNQDIPSGLSGLTNHLIYTEVLAALDISVAAIDGLNNGVFSRGLSIFSQDKEVLDISSRTQNMEVIGSFSLTELSHGSDVKGIRTTATYDSATQQFVVHTPDVEAVKCWSGLLGSYATHSMILAQLYTADGTCHGIHPFLVPVRDPLTLLPYPGVLVGDMGLKIGHRGYANGYAMFSQYRIPHNCLLNKFGGLSPQGEYQPVIPDPGLRFAAMLVTLSSGRVLIACYAVSFLVKCLCIAGRYSAARRQFESGGEEISLIEYPQVQLRLIPRIAALYGMHRLTRRFYRLYFSFLERMQTGELGAVDEASTMELHAASCLYKASCTSYSFETIHECRLLCGGHGFLSCNQLGRIRDDADPSQTYEGDNHVLTQQTLSYLMRIYTQAVRGEIRSHTGLVDFCSHMPDYQKLTCSALTVDQWKAPLASQRAFTWLVCRLYGIAHNQYTAFKRETGSSFLSREKSIAAYGSKLTRALFLLNMLDSLIQLSSPPSQYARIFSPLAALYGCYHLLDFTGELYAGGFFKQSDQIEILSDAVSQLCADLKNETVGLVEALAPPDFVLKSPIGHSNGQVYQNLFGAMLSSNNSTGRISWWRDVMDKPIIGSRHDLIVKNRSKL